MPRTARASVAGSWYHVLNRGNCRAVVFHKPADYDAFVRTLADATASLPVDLLGYCLMPNHFHLVIRTHLEVVELAGLARRRRVVVAWRGAGAGFAVAGAGERAVVCGRPETGPAVGGAGPTLW